MAAYGKGQMLGSGINPESFKQDYSGFANAAAIQAQGLSNLGQSIGGAIDDYGKMKKQQQEDERSVQKSKSVAKAIGDLIPDLKPTLQNSLLLLDNKEIPLSQRKAEADAISDILTLGIGAIGNQQKLALEKAQIEAALNEAKLRAETAGGAAPATVEIPVPGGTQLMQWDRNTQTYVLPKVNMGGASQPSTAATGINSALELTGNLKTDANAINNAIPLPDDFIYTADGSPGSLPPVGTPAVGADASLLPPKPNDVAIPSTAPVLGNNIPQVIPAQGRIGFTPDKTEKVETWRPATAEESAMYGGMPGQMSSTGKFLPINLPSGFSIEQTPEGGLKVIQGAGVGGDKTERAAAERKKQQSGFVDEFIKTATETIGMLPNLPDSPVGAKFGSVLGEILPGTETGRVVSRLNTLKANLALDKINQMRAASPTGGAAGNMTVQEWPLFMQEFGSLDAAENKQDLETRLKNASVKLFNRVNGTPEERQTALKNGVITKEENEIVQKQYEDMLLNLKIPMSPSSGASSPTPVADRLKNLENKYKKNK